MATKTQLTQFLSIIQNNSGSRVLLSIDEDGKAVVALGGGKRENKRGHKDELVVAFDEKGNFIQFKTVENGVELEGSKLECSSCSIVGDSVTPKGWTDGEFGMNCPVCGGFESGATIKTELALFEEMGKNLPLGEVMEGNPEMARNILEQMARDKANV